MFLRGVCARSGISEIPWGAAAPRRCRRMDFQFLSVQATTSERPAICSALCVK